MADGTLVDTEAAAGVALGPMADNLGLLLRLAQLRAFSGYFAALGDAGMAPGELSSLILIREHPGVRQGVLARTLDIKRAHMAKMVAKLEAEGLVARTVPADDRRAMELRLTDAGARRVGDVAPRLIAHEARSAENLTAAETRTLKRLLRKHLGVA